MTEGTQTISIAEQYRDEIERGQVLYREKILPELESTGQASKGLIVVIDIKSGEYEVDPNDAAATSRLIERCPDAFTWTERIGYRTPHAIGGGLVLDY